MGDSGYLLDNRSEPAARRLEALGALLDPVTFRHLERLGAKPGARVWEVGVGGTSVLGFLSTRVGPAGRVLATDIDVSRATPAAADNVEIRKHDVGRDPPPEGPFDVVHARLVLVHVAERDAALRNMASVLCPGGALLVEDADPALQPLASLEVRNAHDELANRMRDGFRTLLGARGVDLAYGRKLPRLLREVGLEDVGADGYFPVAMPACVDLELATVTLLSRDLTNAGLATDAEIERHLENVSKGKVTAALSPLISAWGTKRW